MQTTISGKEVLFVEVPNDAHDLRVNGWLWFKHKDITLLSQGVDIPLGNWQYLFCSATATEEDAKKVVERWANGKWNGYERFLSRVDTALESLQSLILSLGLEINKNYAIC